MRIRAERDDLAAVLARAARAVSTRSPLEILQSILCDVEGNRLTVTGTDLEMTITSSLEVEVLEAGVTAVSARLAPEAVRKLPAGAVTMGTKDGEVEISGSGPRFSLREMNVNDFPKLPAAEAGTGVTVEGDELIRAISQVGVATSSDEARPILTGVQFEGENDSLRLVATDSYRLAVRDLHGVAPQDGLVPVRGLREIHRGIGAPKINLTLGDRSASFSSDNGTLTVRLIEGTFPNYRQLLPSSHQGRLRVNREALVEAVGRASLVAEDHIPLRLALGKGGVDLTVQRQDVGGETEHIDGEYDGEEMTIAFNSRYLNDGLGAIGDEEVVLDVLDGLKPGLLQGAEDGSFRYLLMPVRL